MSLRLPLALAGPVGCCLALILGPLRSAEAQSVAVRKYFPMAWRPGAANRIEFQGESLDRVAAVWTSFPAACVVAPNPASGRLAVEAALPADSPPGLHWVQLSGPTGVSSLIPIFIDPLETVALSKEELAGREGPLVAPPAAFESTSVEDATQRIRFAAEAGRALSFQAVANPLGSQMDSVLRVLDPSGAEVAFCDEHPGVRNDAYLRFTPAVSGVHTLVIHDVAYDGGASHFYRLRLGDFALPETAMAPARLGGLDPASDLDKFGGPIPHGLPAKTDVFEGSFGSPGEVDSFEVRLNKGIPAEFVGAARSLGSPCDLVLRLRGPDGAVVAESNPTGSDEGMLQVTTPAEGTYHLEVSELTGASGAGLRYRVERSPAPSFSLSLESNILELRPGESGKLKLLCKRKGHDGEIRLFLEGGEGLVTLEGAVFPAKKEETDLQLSASFLAKPGTLLHVRLRAEATGAELPQVDGVSTGPALKKAFPLVPYPSRAIDGVLAIGVKE